MKPAFRYGLIALFFLVFLAAAPFIVAFVTGVTYDFHTHEFSKTGSIAVKVTPKAKIFLNGKEVSSINPIALRFLKPGDYTLRLHRDGYFDWEKRLNVKQQYVTYANQDIDNVALFFSSPKTQELAQDVQDFYSGSKRIIYISDGKINLADISSPDLKQELSLPSGLNNLTILPGADENYYLIYNDSYYAVFDARDNRLFDISKLVLGLSAAGAKINGANFQFAGSDLYFLANGTLFKIDWRDSQNSVVLAGVNAYTALGNSIYLLVSNAATQQNSERLQIITTTGANTLIAQLPLWTSAKIYLNNRNEPFVLGDGTFYNIGSQTANRVADSVQDVTIYNQDGLILLSGNNEIDLYNYFNGELNSVTRSSVQIKNPVLNRNLGWVFFLNDNRLQNIELDNRDHQNNYTFAPVSSNAKFYMHPDGNKMFLLSGGKLEQLTIR